MNQKFTFLLSSSSCDPEYKKSHPSDCKFQVKWQINPHMKVGAVSADMAIAQHDSYAEKLRQAGAEVIKLPFIPGAYDSVFIKDNAVLISTKKGRIALIARPYFENRQVEQRQRALEFERLGFQTIRIHEHFEGGDFVMFPDMTRAYLGYGFRSARESAKELSRFLDLPITCLELKDPLFYHLDTALNFILDKRELEHRIIAFAYKEAFTDESWEDLVNDEAINQIVCVNREEALSFGLNWVEVNETIFLGKEVPELEASLKRLGKKVVVSPLDQFQLAGGSAACLSLRVFPLDQKAGGSVYKM